MIKWSDTSVPYAINVVFDQLPYGMINHTVVGLCSVNCSVQLDYDVIILMTIDRGFIFCSDEGYVAYVNNDCIWSSMVPPTRYPPTCRPGQTYLRTKGYSPIATIFKSLYHCPVILFVVCSDW